MFGVPIQAWSKSFFEFISNMVGVFIGDKIMASKSRMNVAILLICTKSFSFIREESKVKIDRDIFKLLLLEDARGVGDSNVKYYS